MRTLVLFQQAFDKSGASSFGHHFDDYSDKNHTVSRYDAWWMPKYSEIDSFRFFLIS